MESKTVRPRSGLKTRMAMWLTVAVIPLFVVAIAGKADAIVGIETESRSHWYVDLNRFALSAHTGFKCEECHGTMIENGRTHPDKANPDFLKKAATRSFDYSRCKKCHKLSYQRYLEGEHAKALSKEMAEAGYGSCRDEKKDAGPHMWRLSFFALRPLRPVTDRGRPTHARHVR